jgi:hypothetical protein
VNPFAFAGPRHDRQYGFQGNWTQEMTMKRSILLIAGVVLGSALLPAHADTLLVERAQRAAAAPLPTRGLTMAQVEARYGAPVGKAGPVGGETALHPPITRWTYADYTVYFERDKVIHSVLNKATAREEGPKPVPR